MTDPWDDSGIFTYILIYDHINTIKYKHIFIYIYTHRIHVWYIYLHEWLMFMVIVGKYTVRPMDPMGLVGGSTHE